MSDRSDHEMHAPRTYSQMESTLQRMPTSTTIGEYTDAAVDSCVFPIHANQSRGIDEMEKG